MDLGKLLQAIEIMVDAKVKERLIEIKEEMKKEVIAEINKPDLDTSITENTTMKRKSYSRTDGSYGTITPSDIGYGNLMHGTTSPANNNLTGNPMIDKAIARSAKVLEMSKKNK